MLSKCGFVVGVLITIKQVLGFSCLMSFVALENVHKV